jgi:hypothetical protein
LIVFIIYIAGIPFGLDLDIFLTHIPLAILLLFVMIYSIYVRLYPHLFYKLHKY